MFINLHPVFGRNPSTEQKEVYKTFDNYVNGKFVYQSPTKSTITSTFKNSNSSGKDRRPVEIP
ncbi:hypothetical protein V7659_31770, partial [Neobacillus drentensis]